MSEGTLEEQLQEARDEIQRLHGIIFEQGQTIKKWDAVKERYRTYAATISNLGRVYSVALYNDFVAAATATAKGILEAGK